MRRYLVVCAAFVFISINSQAYAQTNAPNNNIVKNIEMSEIVLDNSALYEFQQTSFKKDNEFNEIAQVENSENNEENILLPSVQVEPPEKKKRDLNIFQNPFKLQGGVEKSQEEGSVEETAAQKWMHGNYATGQWFGARPFLEEHGLTINSSLLYSPYFKTRGGMNGERAGRGYSLYSLSVTVDTEKAGLWKGGTFFALYQNKRGNGLTRDAMGDWMGLDGWDWRELNQISEYWYQQKLFKDKLRLKFGKQDANMDFAYLVSGWDFMNTSHSVNPTIPLPCYPDQQFGFMAEYSPTKWLSLKNGLYSRFGNPFNISEIEIKPTIKKMPGRYMAGVWALSDSLGMETAAGIDSAGETYYNNYNRNFGLYAAFEQMVYKENKEDDSDTQGLTVFSQFGLSPSNRNDMSKYVSGGLHYRGAIPKRDKDIMGVAVANGFFASRLGPMTSQVGSETSIEAFYRAYISPWFYLQPTAQYIMNASGTYPNSVAIGIRSVITF